MYASGIPIAKRIVRDLWSKTWDFEMSDTDQDRTKRRRPVSEGARVSHSIRLRPSIASKLAREIETSFRSLGEEMEFRISQTFDSIYLTPENSELHKALQVAANANGRTIGQEAEHRLTESFEVEEIYGSRDTRTMLAKIAKRIGMIEKKHGMPWVDAAELPDSKIEETLIEVITQHLQWEATTARMTKPDPAIERYKAFLKEQAGDGTATRGKNAKK